LHQVGTSSLLIYMMHGHTYIKIKEQVIALNWYDRNFMNHPG